MEDETTPREGVDSKRRTVLETVGALGIGSLFGRPASARGTRNGTDEFDLTGTWLTNLGYKVDVTHEGSSVTSTAREPTYCDPEAGWNEEGRGTSSTFDFAGTLRGSEITGELEICYWGWDRAEDDGDGDDGGEQDDRAEDDDPPAGCSNGLARESVTFTVSGDGTTLVGEWRDCEDIRRSTSRTRLTDRVVATGLLGDVVEIDLAETGLTDFEFKSTARHDDPRIPAGHDSPATDVGYVAKFDGWEERLRSDGRFWLVPLSDEVGSIELLGRDGEDRVSVTVDIGVIDDYSRTGDDAVTFETEGLDVYRQQQRLQYFGFPGRDGNPIDVDGKEGPNTAWARGLFCAAVVRGRHAPLATFTDRGAAFLNATNAPRWNELAGGRGYVINPAVSGGPQPERWATSWAREVLEIAASRSPTTLGMQGASVANGAGSRAYHPGGTHQSGMDVDVDTPSTDGPGRPFYRTRTIGGRTYIAAQTDGDERGQRHVVARRGGQFVAASTANGVPRNAIEHDARTYGDRATLEGIADLIVSPRDYDVSTIRSQIESFAGVRTPSGAGVRSVLYNDPRVWDAAGVVVRFSPGHGGHFHVNVSPPPAPQQ